MRISMAVSTLTLTWIDGRFARSVQLVIVLPFVIFGVPAACYCTSFALLARRLAFVTFQALCLAGNASYTEVNLVPGENKSSYAYRVSDKS